MIMLWNAQHFVEEKIKIVQCVAKNSVNMWIAVSREDQYAHVQYVGSTVTKC